MECAKGLIQRRPCGAWRHTAWYERLVLPFVAELHTAYSHSRLRGSANFAFAIVQVAN